MTRERKRTTVKFSIARFKRINGPRSGLSLPRRAHVKKKNKRYLHTYTHLYFFSDFLTNAMKKQKRVAYKDEDIQSKSKHTRTGKEKTVNQK